VAAVAAMQAQEAVGQDAAFEEGIGAWALLFPAGAGICLRLPRVRDELVGQLHRALKR